MPKQGPSNLARLSLLMPTLLEIMNVTKVDCSSECVEHGWDGLGQALHKSRLRPLLFEHLHLMTSRKKAMKIRSYSSSKRAFQRKVVQFKAVFRIRDMLVRIRILGTLPLTNRSGCGSVPKSSVTFRMQKSIFFFIFLMIKIKLLARKF
jgi:hypothetical protein